jgi:hypothetical protein
MLNITGDYHEKRISSAKKSKQKKPKNSLTMKRKAKKKTDERISESDTD